jgi:hypothetical protein
MKKAFPILLIVIGFAFVLGGGYTVYRGIDARNLVESELAAQRITTPEDASLPNVVVNDVASAESMAAIINEHALKSTGGLTYSEMGRFATPDGAPKGTNEATAAAKDAAGKPVANAARNTAFQASSLRTSLYSSMMAFEIATLVTGLGIMLAALGIAVGGTGIAFAGLSIPAVSRRVHVPPVATTA